MILRRAAAIIKSNVRVIIVSIGSVGLIIIDQVPRESGREGMLSMYTLTFLVLYLINHFFFERRGRD